MLLTEVNQATVGPVPIQAHDPIVVLLIDDQFILGEAMRDMLESERDIQLHFCQEPLEAVLLA